MENQTVNFINPKKYNFDFRPKTYFEVDDPLQELLTNIKGENRRKLLKKTLQNLDVSDDLPDYIFREKLSEDERQMFGMFHRTNMGGEYLPDRGDNEVEIARVVLDSTTQDVLSLRAKQSFAGIISYQLLDEYEFEYTITPNRSAQPLTFGELILLFGSVKDESNERQSIPAMFREFFEIDRGFEEEEVKECSKFVVFDSEFYPQLTRYYEDEARIWYREQIQLLKKLKREWRKNV